jgi:hypothetical protein
MIDGSKFGTSAKRFWDDSMRKLEARVAHARGDITDEQLADVLGPPPPPGTSFTDVIRAIRRAPDGTFAGMLRKSGQEILTAAAMRAGRRAAKRNDEKR